MKPLPQVVQKPGVVLVIAVLLPVLLIAGATGQLGVFVLVAASLLGAFPAAARFKRTGIPRPAIPPAPTLDEFFPRPPPVSL
jgi:hypothetical protein